MSTFVMTGLENAVMSEDRSCFDIQVRTDHGLVTLSVRARHLDELITRLQGLEYRASLLDPAKGNQPGEMGLLRAEIVESHQVGSADVNGEANVVLALKTSLVRVFAMSASIARAMQQSLADEIERLEARPASH